MSLKKKTLHGFGWSFVDNIGNQGVTFLVGVVLARLLTPNDFGLVAMITVFTAISNTFIDSGFTTALIRKQDCSQHDYSTVFFFNLGVGSLLFLLLYVTAPLISTFFKQPGLTSITRVLALGLIISSISVIQRTILTKNIDFKLQTKISLVSSIGSGVIGIAMAFMGFGVWSLVGQLLSRQLLQSLMLWLGNRWRPSLVFSKSSFKELFGFGSKILASSLLDTVYKNINSLVIGRFFSSATLGHYTNADKFQSVFSSNLTQTIQRVSYPVLSAIQDDLVKLKQAYRKLIINTMMATFALMLGLAAAAKPVILLSIGNQWEQVIPYLQLLCLSGMLYPLHAINLNVINVKGRSDLYLKLEIIKKVIAVPVIVVAIFWGVYALLIGMVVTSVISFFLNSYYSADMIGYSTREQLADILPLLGVSIVVAIPMWLVTFLNWNLFATLAVQIVVGLALSYVIYDRIKLTEFVELKAMFVGFIKKMRNGRKQ